jgi:hypothetical protein
MGGRQLLEAPENANEAVAKQYFKCTLGRFLAGRPFILQCV